MVLGDNIIESSIRAAVDAFRRSNAGARILLKEVPDAERFGVAEVDGDRIVGIEEKPQASEIELRGHRHLHVRRHGLRQDHKPDAVRRGELEITDVNNAYIREGTMTFSYPRWLVDRRGHLRIPAARRQSGGASQHRRPGKPPRWWQRADAASECAAGHRLCAASDFVGDLDLAIPEVCPRESALSSVRPIRQS